MCQLGKKNRGRDVVTLPSNVPAGKKNREKDVVISLSNVPAGTNTL